MATLTVYDASKGGRLYYQHAVYATAHNFGTASSFVQTEASVGQRPPGSTYGIWRSAALFDTSSVPSGSAVTLAQLSLYGVTDNSTDDFDIVIRNGQPARPSDPVVQGDYDCTFYAGDGGSINSSACVVGSYNTITMNATGRGWINCGGTTKLMLISQEDIDSSAPTANEYFVFEGPTHGGGNDPKLYLEYTSPSAVPAHPALSLPLVPTRPFGKQL